MSVPLNLRTNSQLRDEIHALLDKKRGKRLTGRTIYFAMKRVDIIRQRAVDKVVIYPRLKRT